MKLKGVKRVLKTRAKILSRLRKEEGEVEEHSVKGIETKYGFVSKVHLQSMSMPEKQDIWMDVVHQALRREDQEVMVREFDNQEMREEIIHVRKDAEEDEMGLEVTEEETEHELEALEVTDEEETVRDQEETVLEVTEGGTACGQEESELEVTEEEAEDEEIGLEITEEETIRVLDESETARSGTGKESINQVEEKVEFEETTYSEEDGSQAIDETGLVEESSTIASEDCESQDSENKESADPTAVPVDHKIPVQTKAPVVDKETKKKLFLKSLFRISQAHVENKVTIEATELTEKELQAKLARGASIITDGNAAWTLPKDAVSAATTTEKSVSFLETIRDGCGCCAALDSGDVPFELTELPEGQTISPEQLARLEDVGGLVGPPKQPVASRDLAPPVVIKLEPLDLLGQSLKDIEVLLPEENKKLSRMDLLRSESPAVFPAAGHFYRDDESSAFLLHDGEVKEDDDPTAHTTFDEDDSKHARPLRVIQVTSNRGFQVSRQDNDAAISNDESEATRVMDNSTIATHEQHTILSLELTPF